MGSDVIPKSAQELRELAICFLVEDAMKRSLGVDFVKELVRAAELSVLAATFARELDQPLTENELAQLLTASWEGTRRTLNSWIGMKVLRWGPQAVALPNGHPLAPTCFLAYHSPSRSGANRARLVFPSGAIQSPALLVEWRQADLEDPNGCWSAVYFGHFHRHTKS
jgi:hypothetical protein